jgi:hypothetical protein
MVHFSCKVGFNLHTDPLKTWLIFCLKTAAKEGALYVIVKIVNQINVRRVDKHNLSGCTNTCHTLSVRLKKTVQERKARGTCLHKVTDRVWFKSRGTIGYKAGNKIIFFPHMSISLLRLDISWINQTDTAHTHTHTHTHTHMCNMWCKYTDFRSLLRQMQQARKAVKMWQLSFWR